MIVRKISEPKFSSFMCPNSFPFDIQLTGGYQCKILQIYIRKPIQNLPQCNICNNFIFLFLIEKNSFIKIIKTSTFLLSSIFFFLFFWSDIKNCLFFILTNTSITSFTDTLYDILFIRCKLKCYSHHFIIYMS